MFSEGMPAISGKWLNKRTGNQIMVRDSIIDGDNMMILSDIGQISMDEFSRDYIQVSEDIYDNSGKAIGKANDGGIIDIPTKQPNIQTKPQDITELIDIDPDSIPKKKSPKKKDVVEETKQTEVKNQSVQQTSKNGDTIKNADTIKNIDIIGKVFTKIKTKPTISISIDWNEFPKQEISTLTNFLDVDKTEIAKYIREYYMNDAMLIKLIEEFIDNME